MNNSVIDPASDRFLATRRGSLLYALCAKITDSDHVMIICNTSQTVKTLLLGLLPLYVLFFGGLGCGSDSQIVRIVTSVSPEGEFSTEDRALTSLESRSAVRGTSAVVLGGTTIDLQVNPMDGGASRGQIALGSTSVRAQWIGGEGVIIPSDFTSLSMFSAYAHIEAAANYFQGLGVVSANDQVPIYFNPSIPNASQFGLPRADNAAYFSAVDGFLLLPMRVFQDIPFPMNDGVMAHEYAHRVFYYEAWGGRQLGAIDVHASTPGSLGAFNRIRALDEGLADFFATAVTGNPRYLRASVFEEISAPRDVDVQRTLDPTWVAGLEPLDPNGTFNPYAAGSVLASWLWTVAQQIGLPEVEAAILVAQRSLTNELVNNFNYSIGNFEIAFIGALTPAQQTVACTELRVPYDTIWSRFAGTCP